MSSKINLPVTSSSRLRVYFTVKHTSSNKYQMQLIQRRYSLKTLLISTQLRKVHFINRRQIIKRKLRLQKKLKC